MNDDYDSNGDSNDDDFDRDSYVRHTSAIAYAAIQESGLLTVRQWEAYAALYAGGPYTGQELCKATGCPGMWKRCSELQDKGVVDEIGETKCRVTGYLALLWDVNGREGGVLDSTRAQRCTWVYDILSTRYLSGCGKTCTPPLSTWKFCPFCRKRLGLPAPLTITPS